jgi:hypothetical protein
MTRQAAVGDDVRERVARQVKADPTTEPEMPGLSAHFPTMEYHGAAQYRAECDCGFKTKPGNFYIVKAEWAEHVAAIASVPPVPTLAARETDVSGEADVRDCRQENAGASGLPGYTSGQSSGPMERRGPGKGRDDQPTDRSGTAARPPGSTDTELHAAHAELAAVPPVPIDDLTRPIIGISNRTAQEAFDIMVDRIRGCAALHPNQPGDR